MRLRRELLFLLLTLCLTCNAGRPGRKKVVIVGEMSDAAFELATNASASSSSSSHLDDDYDAPPVSSSVVRRPIRKRLHRPASGPNSGLFVPVAAYSVTHSRRPSASSPSHVSNRRMRPSTTESAVYGYLQKPDLVEFRGQYFYGPNSVPPGHASSASSYLPAASSPYHRAHHGDWHDLQSAGSSLSRQSGKSGKSGLGPGGLLLATLPLILAPMLSYLFTPMVIPVTATIAAGRRRRRRSTFGNHLPFNLTLLMHGRDKINHFAEHFLKHIASNSSSSYLNRQ